MDSSQWTSKSTLTASPAYFLVISELVKIIIFLWIIYELRVTSCKTCQVVYVEFQSIRSKLIKCALAISFHSKILCRFNQC